MKLWSSPDVRSLVRSSNAQFWGLTVKSAVLIEGMAFISLHAVKTRSPWITNGFWEGDKLVQLDPSIASALPDQHFWAANNTNDRYIQAYLNADQLYVRAQQPTTIPVGTWFQTNLAYPIS